MGGTLDKPDKSKGWGVHLNIHATWRRLYFTLAWHKCFKKSYKEKQTQKGHTLKISDCKGAIVS